MKQEKSSLAIPKNISDIKITNDTNFRRQLTLRESIASKSKNSISKSDTCEKNIKKKRNVTVEEAKMLQKKSQANTSTILHDSLFITDERIDSDSNSVGVKSKTIAIATTPSDNNKQKKWWQNPLEDDIGESSLNFNSLQNMLNKKKDTKNDTKSLSKPSLDKLTNALYKVDNDWKLENCIVKRQKSDTEGSAIKNGMSTDTKGSAIKNGMSADTKGSAIKNGMSADTKGSAIKTVMSADTKGSAIKTAMSADTKVPTGTRQNITDSIRMTSKPSSLFQLNSLMCDPKDIKKSNIFQRDLKAMDSITTATATTTTGSTTRTSNKNNKNKSFNETKKQFQYTPTETKGENVEMQLHEYDKKKRIQNGEDTYVQPIQINKEYMQKIDQSKKIAIINSKSTSSPNTLRKEASKKLRQRIEKKRQEVEGDSDVILSNVVDTVVHKEILYSTIPKYQNIQRSIETNTVIESETKSETCKYIPSSSPPEAQFVTLYHQSKLNNTKIPINDIFREFFKCQIQQWDLTSVPSVIQFTTKYQLCYEDSISMKDDLFEQTTKQWYRIAQNWFQKVNELSSATGNTKTTNINDEKYLPKQQQPVYSFESFNEYRSYMQPLFFLDQHASQQSSYDKANMLDKEYQQILEQCHKIMNITNNNNIKEYIENTIQKQTNTIRCCQYSLHIQYNTTTIFRGQPQVCEMTRCRPINITIGRYEQRCVENIKKDNNINKSTIYNNKLVLQPSTWTRTDSFDTNIVLLIPEAVEYINVQQPHKEDTNIHHNSMQGFLPKVHLQGIAIKQMNDPPHLLNIQLRVDEKIFNEALSMNIDINMPPPKYFTSKVEFLAYLLAENRYIRISNDKNYKDISDIKDDNNDKIINNYINLIKGIKNNTTNNTILSIPSVLSMKLSGIIKDTTIEPWKPRIFFRVMFLTTQVPHMREYFALHFVPYTLMGKYIQSPIINKIKDNNNNKKQIINTTMNRNNDQWSYITTGQRQYFQNTQNISQFTAIENAVRDASTTGGFTLQQGPPGTGKTKTVIAQQNVLHLSRFSEFYEQTVQYECTNIICKEQRTLLYEALQKWIKKQTKQYNIIDTIDDKILKEYEVILRRILEQLGQIQQSNYRTPQKPRILVCAPSNAGVDEIIDRQLQDEQRDGNQCQYRPTITRLGNSTQMRRGVRDTISVIERMKEQQTQPYTTLENRYRLLCQEKKQIEIKMESIRNDIYKYLRQNLKNFCIDELFPRIEQMQQEELENIEINKLNILINRQYIICEKVTNNLSPHQKYIIQHFRPPEQILSVFMDTITQDEAIQYSIERYDIVLRMYRTLNKRNITNTNTTINSNNILTQQQGSQQPSNIMNLSLLELYPSCIFGSSTVEQRNSFLNEATILFSTCSGADELPLGYKRSQLVSSESEENAQLRLFAEGYDTTTIDTKNTVLDEHPFYTFDEQIIDEAGQCSEQTSQVAQSRSVRHCVQVGDPKQLPGTVFQQDPQYRLNTNVINKVINTTIPFGVSSIYETSLFERQQRGGHPVHMQTIQYRMHPTIRMFPSLKFYNNLLEDAPTVLQDKILNQPFYNDIIYPFTFFHIQSSVPLSNNTITTTNKNTMTTFQFKNEAEIRACVEIVDFLIKKQLIPQQDIGIITFYNEQKRLQFNEQIQFNYQGVECRTVDGFQGREKRIIQVSCVRSNILQHNGIGFLREMGRINVALTRARQLVLVFGDMQTLQQSPGCWRDLLELIQNNTKLYKNTIYEQIPQHCRYRLHIWNSELIRKLWQDKVFVPPVGLRPVTQILPSSNMRNSSITTNTTDKNTQIQSNPLSAILLDPDVNMLLESMYSSNGQIDTMTDDEQITTDKTNDEFQQFRRR